MIHALRILAAAACLPAAVLGLASCQASSPDAIPPSQSVSQPAPTVLQHDWQTYTNVRFGYSICYPADALLAQGESENGDGQKFVSKDEKSQLLAYGSYNVLDQRLSKVYADEIKSAEAEGLKVTYQLLKPAFFVISGAGSGKMRYQKTALVGDTFKTFRLDYPESAKADYDPIAAHLASCFNPNLKSEITR